MHETLVHSSYSFSHGVAEADRAAVLEKPWSSIQYPFLDIERLIPYVNDLTAGPLNLPFHNPIGLNTDIEAQDCLESRLTRLHNLAGDQPRVRGKTIASPQEIPWPYISVVVCSFNGARTIHDTLEALLRLDYLAYEVIVVDDGSTDATASMVQPYGFQLISTEHRGLSNARNTGMQAAHGEIVAYINDDVYPDPHWLTHLAITFIRTNHVGVGGPHLTSDDGGWIADCVANAPGGPVHVLLGDRDVAHMPGCNMAFRKSTLQSIGGFDPRYRIAGDDVDVCWRLQRRGWTLGFHPAAVVWHHRHHPIRRYWDEQKGYGWAEVLLEEKWPLKSCEFGHMTWAGRFDGKGLTRTINVRQGHVYQDTWCHVRFQRRYEPAPNVLCVLPLLPSWYLLTGTLAVLAVLSLLWPLLLYSLPLLAIAVGVPLGQAASRAHAAVFTATPLSRVMCLKYRLLTASLHVIQPIARWYGRLSYRFTHWRVTPPMGLLWPRTISLWRETWREHIDHLQVLKTVLCNAALFVQPARVRGRWDLEVRGGLFGKVRTRMTVSEHGPDKPMTRFRVWPMGSVYGLGLSFLFALLSIGAMLDQAYMSAAILGSATLIIVYRILQESAWAMSGLLEGLKRLGAGD